MAACYDDDVTEVITPHVYKEWTKALKNRMIMKTNYEINTIIKIKLTKNYEIKQHFTTIIMQQT